MALCWSAPTMQRTYLRAKALHENGNQQIEQHVITECHQCNEVQCRPVASLFHAIEKHNIPIFLR